MVKEIEKLFKQGLMTKEEFLEINKFGNPIKICCPERETLEKMIKKHFLILASYYSNDPENQGCCPIYALGKR